MKANNFNSKAVEYLFHNELVLLPEQIDKLSHYYNLTLDWGNKMNITNNLDPQSYLCENFLDPIVGLHKYISAGYAIHGLIDLGAGGGYVGLTAKILYPDMGFCLLVESIRKKVSFLQMVIRELNLPQTQAIQARAEDVLPNIEFDTVVSRATWAWQDLKVITNRFLINGKKLISFEGPVAHQIQQDPPKSVLEYEIRPFERKRYIYCLSHPS